MRIVCPSCSAAYEVPDRILAAGKKVRCARCGENWLPEEAAGLVPPEPPPPPPPVLVPVPPPRMPESAMSALEPAKEAVAAANPAPSVAVPVTRPPGNKPPQGRLPVALALGVSTLVLAALLAAAVVWRGGIMSAWPSSQRLFGWLGLG